MKRIILLLLAVFGLSLSTFAQGPLTPPGPPAPTMKTLQQIEPRTAITNLPYTITASGSYYVTTNLTPAANQNGIVIAADNVTIDLEGFELVGAGGGSGEGISSAGAHTNIVIRNGTVRSWPGSGINLYDFASYQGSVQGIRAVGNTFTGIAVGKSSRVVDCMAAGNNDKGILMDADCAIEHCEAFSNLGIGISAGATARIADNLSSHNRGSGISASSGSVISGCTANGNGDGISAGAGSTVRDCVARSNTGDGVNVTGPGTIIGCTSSSNGGRGIAAGASLGGNCTVVNCTAQSNGGAGIDAGSGSTIRECTSAANTNGIVVNAYCLVLDNTCDANALFDIRTSGLRNRIDGNHVHISLANGGSTVGISSAGTNLIVRNTIVEETGFAFENRSGDILGSLIVNFGGLTNHDPFANFVY
jgi:Right handed beta helix region